MAGCPRPLTENQELSNMYLEIELQIRCVMPNAQGKRGMWWRVIKN